MANNIRCVDLFCGCGGMSLGFEKAGFNVVAGIDNWKPAIQVYKKNFSHPVIEQDLLDVDNAVETVLQFSPDLIIGGPPCQDFSTAGFQDESRGRAILSVRYSQIVCIVKPQYFVMENVATIRNTNSFRAAIDNFSSAGYGLTKMILDAAYHWRGKHDTRAAPGLLPGIGGTESMAEIVESGVLIRDVETKNIMTKSTLPVGGYSVNPYVGCTHGCKYCYASFMKRFTGHTEPWGTFLDVKHWPAICWG